MSDAYDFDEQLEMGLNWESELSDRLESVLTRTRIENIIYEEDAKTQRSGIDAVIHREDPEFDVKVQRNEHINTGNLPFEVWSVESQSVPGWFYSGESDIIVWAYETKASDNLHPTGYFMLKNEWLIDWFNERIEKFQRVSIPNTGRYGEYMTVIRLVPIKDIPDSHLIEFNPTLKQNRNTEQYELVEYL